MSATATPPFLETAILGGLLRWNEPIGDVAQILNPSDFTTAKNCIVFEHILALYLDGKPVDLVTVADSIYAAGKIDHIGGHGYLGELWDKEPTGAHAVYYAKQLRQQSMLRQLAGAASGILESIKSPTGPPEEILGDAEASIFKISRLGSEKSTATIPEIVDEACDRLDKKAAGPVTSGVQTGFIDLDFILGGFRAGELTILAARPSVGKTALAVAITYDCMNRQKIEPFIVSLEQSKEELADRFLIFDSGVSSSAFRSGKIGPEAMHKLSASSQILRRFPGHVDDLPGQGMARIMSNARRLRAKANVGIVIVDYLQLIEPETKKESRQEQVAGISRRLKQMARELSVPVVALCQLSRATEQSEEPRLSHLRESGGIEADADTVILLHRKSEGSVCDVIEALVAKQRNGPTGRVNLSFRKSCMRFENYAVQP